ncbi:hypothetical protein D3C85_670800 [compost metagenome]
MIADISADLETRVASNSAICSEMVFMSRPSSGFGITGSFFVTGAEAPAGFPTRTTGTTDLPSAASCLRDTDFTEVIRPLELHGMVTAESSNQSHFRYLEPQEPSIRTLSIGRKPIDKPRTRPALIDCQASSKRSLSLPSSSTLAIFIVASMPAGETLTAITWPIGSSDSCCHRNGIGKVYSAPSGTMMSSARSGAGVLATPVMILCSSSTALTVIML